MVARNAPDPIREMYRSLDRRYRPEDVAQLVLDAIGNRLSAAETRIVGRAARGALRHGHGYSSMSQDFARPVGMSRQIATAAELFDARPPEADAHADPVALTPYLAGLGGEIRKAPGANHFKADRLNRAARESAGLDLSKRQYNKRFRLLARMERKRDRIARELRKRSFALVAKSRLASTLTWDVFARDPDSACFVAYFAARCNLRSEFTIWGQQRPFDEIADALFTRLRNSGTANWWAVAHVFPDREVLARLADTEKGELLGRWYATLQDIAGLLREVWATTAVDRRTMIVRRGNDSTTWNYTAGAWNKARESWVALLDALDMGDVLDPLCPGKVLRLMAADVAAWHRSAGGGLDPDTAVWADLPAPWEVLAGEAECPRALVEGVCRRHGVDPVKNAWTAPRSGRTVAAFRPTPELVHGVTVGNPFLANWLKKAGFFSGKELKLLVDS